MESNGLGSKGLNPDANLEVLQKPSEPHFNKSPGIASFSVTRCCEEKAEKQRIESQEEEEGVSFKMIVLSDEETFAVTVILDANRCIFSSFQVRSIPKLKLDSLGDFIKHSMCNATP